MIKVTRLNGEELYVNSDLIEFIEETPDTVLSLTTSKKIVVKENAEEVIRRIIDFRRKIAEGLPRGTYRCEATPDADVLE